MNHFYLLEVSIIWLALYLVYLLLLSEETFFAWNRWYLLGTMVLGPIIPLLVIPEIFPVARASNNNPSLTVDWEMRPELQVINASPSAAGPAWQEMLHWVYFLGVVFMALRLLLGLRKIWKKIPYPLKKKWYEPAIIEQNGLKQPFSFFHWVFLNDISQYTADDVEKIISHEKAHVRLKHSLDVLLAEFTTILFWCCPPIYLYRAALRLLHEYQADAVASASIDKKQYGLLLIRQSMSGPRIAVANYFFHSELKQRIMMMTKHPSTKTAQVKYLVLLPVLFLLLAAFAQKRTADPTAYNNGKASIISPSETSMQSDTGIFKIVEEMPRFPGCEELAGAERKNCADKAMVAFIGNHLNYPKVAKDHGIQGIVVVTFVVDEAGKIHNVQTIRDIGAGCGDEAKRVAESMPDFIPGKQKGKNVKVQFNLPIRFQLDDAPLTESKNIVEQPTKTTFEDYNGEEVFKIVEEMPRFPGCEEEQTDFAAKKACADKKMLEFIYTNIKYPKVARDASVEGMVVVSFVVTKEGKTVNPKIIKAIGGGCDEEVLRIFGQMPTWVPGKQRGRNVNVEFKLPIRFKLEGTSPSFAGLPAFPACQDITDEGKRNNCAGKAMLEYIYKTVKYPKADREAGIEGEVIVGFTIKADGSLVGAKIVKDLGGELGNELLSVVNQLPKKWTPALENGKPVDKWVHLPALFKLEGDEGQNGAEPKFSTPRPNSFPGIVVVGYGTSKPSTSIDLPQEKQLKVSNFSLSPNPSAGDTRLQFEAPEGNTIIQVLDLNGKELFRRNLSHFNGAFNEVIQLPNAAKGIVLFRISQGEQLFSKQVVIQ